MRITFRPDQYWVLGTSSVYITASAGRVFKNSEERLISPKESFWLIRTADEKRANQARQKVKVPFFQTIKRMDPVFLSRLSKKVSRWNPAASNNKGRNGSMCRSW